MSLASAGFEQVREGGPAQAGVAFGLTYDERSRSLTPCPACGAETRHPRRGDPRGAVGITRDGGGWHCFECENGGDAVRLAAWLTVHRVPEKGNPAWRDVGRTCAKRGLCGDGQPATTPAAPRRVPVTHPPAPSRPPGVLDAWQHCIPVTEDAEVLNGSGLEAWIRWSSRSEAWRALSPELSA